MGTQIGVEFPHLLSYRRRTVDRIPWDDRPRGRGGIGRRAGLKIRFRKECRFDSDRPHHLSRSLSPGFRTKDPSPKRAGAFRHQRGYHPAVPAVETHNARVRKTAAIAPWNNRLTQNRAGTIPLWLEMRSDRVQIRVPSRSFRQIPNSEKLARARRTRIRSDFVMFVVPIRIPSKKKGRRLPAPAPFSSNQSSDHAGIGSSLFCPAMRIIAFCSFSKARTSIWRTRSRETP